MRQTAVERYRADVEELARYRAYVDQRHNTPQSDVVIARKQTIRRELMLALNGWFVRGSRIHLNPRWVVKTEYYEYIDGSIRGVWVVHGGRCMYCTGWRCETRYEIPLAEVRPLINRLKVLIFQSDLEAL